MADIVVTHESRRPHVTLVFGWPEGVCGVATNLGLMWLGVVCLHDGAPALQLLQVVLGVQVCGLT